MRFLIILLLITNCSGCFGKWRNKFPDDTIPGRLSPNKNARSISSMKLVEDLKVEETTFQEVLQTFGDIYRVRMTFDPPYKAKYKNKYYEIKYRLAYYYFVEGKYNLWINLFFDTNEKLAFTYIFNREYPRQTEYHDNPVGEDMKYFSDCELKYYERVSNPVFVTWGDAREGLWRECEWEKDYPEHRTIDKMREDKIKRDAESARQKAEAMEKRRKLCEKNPTHIECSLLKNQEK